MKRYIYFIIFILIISCSSNKGVYWCGDHACANNKEKEAYFKKTMIVEVRNLDKNNRDQVSANEKILNQSRSKKKNIIIAENNLEQEISLEEEKREMEQQIEIQEQVLEQQIEIQEQEIAERKENINEQIDLEEEAKNKENIEKKKLSTLDKAVEIKEVGSKSFDELVENISVRNSTRSYPKINDIPK